VPEYELVTDAQALKVASQTLAQGSGPAAVDVERASGFRYSQRAYLVQIFREDAGTFLIDPTSIGDIAPLREALSGYEWVLHAASQDLPSLRELDLVPDSIFDTELAARILGYEKVGLAAIVERIMGITLAKEHSAADWSTRPLPESWLEYAALDVIYLVEIRNQLATELEEQGKTEIARQEFEATRIREPKPQSEEPWRRLSGLHQIKGARSLTIARELWYAREEFARTKDVAPGRLVPDRSLTAAVLADPKSKGELAALKNFHGRASRSELDRWWSAIVRGRTAPEVRRMPADPDAMPPTRAWAERNPDADLRYKRARPVVEAIAEELGLPTENLLTPEYLRRLAWKPSGLTTQAVASDLTTLGARPWQIERTAQSIAEAFVEASQIESTPDAVTS
jgi:ribonuclease D